MLTRRLAEFVIGTDTKDSPAEVLTGSCHALIDTVGCGLAGTLEPVGELPARWVQETGARRLYRRGDRNQARPLHRAR